MGRVTIFFYLWPGEGHNYFVSVQGKGRDFLGALFKKLVALPPPGLNNDTSFSFKFPISFTSALSYDNAASFILVKTKYLLPFFLTFRSLSLMMQYTLRIDLRACLINQLR